MAGTTLNRGKKKPRPLTAKERGSVETEPTDQQWVFIRAYASNNFRLGPAAREAGYSVHYARQLMMKSHIQRECAKLVREQGHKHLITQDRIIRELCAIAFCDESEISRLVNTRINEPHPDLTQDEPLYSTRVEFTPTDDLDEFTRRAIAGMESTENGVKVKTHDKVKALQLLMMHLGMLEKGQGANPEDHARAVREALLGIEKSTVGD